MLSSLAPGGTCETSQSDGAALPPAGVEVSPPVRDRFGRRVAFFGPAVGFGLGLGVGWPYYDCGDYYGDSCWVWTPDGYTNVCYGNDYYYY